MFYNILLFFADISLGFHFAKLLKKETVLKSSLVKSHYKKYLITNFGLIFY